MASDAAPWWRGFDDPVLDRWITLALAGNLDLDQAAARVQQARAGVSFSRAARQPTGEITAQATGTRQSLEGPLGNIISAFPGFDRDIAQFDAGIGASWELDLFGGLARGQNAALGELLASEAGRRAAQQMVDAEIAAARGREAEALAAYRLAVLRASEDVENAAAAQREGGVQWADAARTIDALGRSLAAQRAAHAADTIALVDVLEATRQLTAAQDSHIQTSANLSRATIQLARAIGANADGVQP